jgi:hypothetical protein
MLARRTFNHLLGPLRRPASSDRKLSFITLSVCASGRAFIVPPAADDSLGPTTVDWPANSIAAATLA